MKPGTVVTALVFGRSDRMLYSRHNASAAPTSTGADTSPTAGSPSDDARASVDNPESIPHAVADGGWPFPSGRWGSGGEEIRAATSGGSLWALLFGRQPIRPRIEMKIIWAAVGAGDLELIGISPGGSPLDPSHPAAEIGGGNWKRPGVKFVGGFLFPSAGCWRIHAERGATTGDIWVE